MYCKKCGLLNPEESKYCQHCGIKFNEPVILKNNTEEKNVSDKKSGLGIWFVAGGLALIFFIYLFFIFIKSLETEPEPVVSSQSEEYNQEEIASSVVNIFCPSNVSGEETIGGSGTILSEGGIILTNSHIIPQDKDNIHVDDRGCLVILPDSQTGQPKEAYLAHPIVLRELSDQYDLAYMSIYAAYFDEDSQEYSGEYPRIFPAFDDTTRCTNESIKLGDSIRIFGYPAISGGYSLTITDGLVSSFPGEGLIITSAKISHGNSGGLAIDKSGCMVGVPTYVNSDENESLGIILSIDIINKFSEEVMKNIETQ